jgi:hypothetical protein
MNKKWYISGCSISTANYVEHKKDAYPYLVADYFSKEIVLLSTPGNSNQTIFTNAIQALLNKDSELVFVQITTPGRQLFNHSLHYKSSTLGLTCPILIDTRWKQFTNVYSFLDQEYNQYVLLNQYVPILNNLAKLTNKKIIFINGYLFFDSAFFNNEIEENYYLLKDETKIIINFDNDTDENLKDQFDDIRKKLSVIDPTQWITLIKPLCDYSVDKGIDGTHPGLKSNAIFAKLIIDYLEHNDNQ